MPPFLTALAWNPKLAGPTPEQEYENPLHLGVQARCEDA
jgi:hypothetical protein